MDKEAWQAQLQKMVILQSQTLVVALWPVGRGESNGLFHMALASNVEQRATGLNPAQGHWKSDCPAAGLVPVPQCRSSADCAVPTLELLGLANDN